MKESGLPDDENEENDLDENGSPDAENLSEVSFNDDLNLSEGREDQSSMALVDTKNIGGGKLLSWGTGYQKGMKLGYQSPEEKHREKIAWESQNNKYKLQEDRLTVATSNDKDAISMVSNASTGFYSQECKRLEDAV